MDHDLKNLLLNLGMFNSGIEAALVMFDFTSLEAFKNVSRGDATLQAINSFFEASEERILDRDWEALLREIPIFQEARAKRLLRQANREEEEEHDAYVVSDEEEEDIDEEEFQEFEVLGEELEPLDTVKRRRSNSPDATGKKRRGPGKGPRKCGYCGEPGHYKRTCQKNPAVLSKQPKKKKKKKKKEEAKPELNPLPDDYVEPYPQPKRGKPAFIFFRLKRGPELRMLEQYKNSRPSEISKVLGLEWNALSELDKGPFLKLATQDKLESHRKLAEWKQAGGIPQRRRKKKRPAVNDEAEASGGAAAPAEQDSSEGGKGKGTGKGTRRCTRCHMKGHNKATCSKRERDAEPALSQNKKSKKHKKKKKQKKHRSESTYVPEKPVIVLPPLPVPTLVMPGIAGPPDIPFL